MEHNAELKEFLRSRRARLNVADLDVGGGGGARRVPGLRREEVALLAGVSVDYYTRLEQGRPLNVSDQVLDAIARALKLDETERGYLFQIARGKPQRRRSPAPPQRVRPGILRLLETLGETTPAFVFGRRMDALAGNRLANALLGDILTRPPRDRNLLRFTFLDETSRAFFMDWEEVAKDNLGVLRLDVARHPDDPLLAELIGELSMKSPEFRRWWADHDVRERTHGIKRYLHPLVGELELNYESLQLPGDPDQTMCVYTTEPGSPAETALQLLANWTGTPAEAPAQNEHR
ncbi:XRE family transcriptional regulator [Pseudonocardiaceae bacterium YIM PH 21723]|nr:XRE family transcriptional regulator [Pseudonocardiaceae bacterium YIM PH 21723]